MEERSNNTYMPSLPRHLCNSGIIGTVYSGLTYIDQMVWAGLPSEQSMIVAAKQFPISYGTAMVNAYTYNHIRRRSLDKGDSLAKAMSKAIITVSLFVGACTWILQEKTGTDGAALLGLKAFCINVPAAALYDFVFLQHQGKFKAALLAVFENNSY